MLLLFLSRLRWPEARTSSSLFVNNRASSASAIAFSIVVSCVGASATMGTVGLAFAIGTPAVWWLLCGAAGLLALSLILAEKVRCSGCHAGDDGKPHGAFGQACGGSYYRCRLGFAAQFTALAALLSGLTGWNGIAALVAGFVLVTVHTMGGQAAVIRTDRFHFFLLLAGLGGMPLVFSMTNPGWFIGVSPSLTNPQFPADDALKCLLLVGNYLVCPMLFGRFLGARDTATARRGGVAAAVLLAFAAMIIIVAIGLACRELVAPDTPPDAVLAEAVTVAFSGWTSIPVCIALIGIVVSSADSCLATAATVLSHDLLNQNQPAFLRRCIAGLGLAGLCVALLDRARWRVSSCLSWSRFSRENAVYAKLSLQEVFS